jgi:iron(III) transport system permease protein
MIAKADRAIAWCALGGIAAFVLLPWFTVPDGLLSLAVPGALIADYETASAAGQVLLYRKPGLMAALLALAVCLASLAFGDSRARRWALIAAGFGGALAVFSSGLGLAADAPVASGIAHLSFGWGSTVVIAALLMLGSFGLARTGAFRGDLFTSAVAVMAACVLVIFVVYPLARGLGAAFVDAAGDWDLSAGWARVANERVWSLACVASGSPCGVAWNTLFLAVLTAAGTTLMGTLLALAEFRSDWRFRKAIRLLTPLPFVTPPFVAGLALILVFGRSGFVNQWLEWLFGISPSRWFYGLFGLWLAQMFAFAPVAFLMMRAVVQGLNPSLEEAARTLRASPRYIYRRITLPLLLPGLANAFLVGFLESVSDFGNPAIVGGQYGVLSTEIFYAIVGAQFDRGRAAALAWILALLALSVFALQRAVLGKRSYATLDGTSHAGAPLPLPAPWKHAVPLLAAPWIVFTVALYAFAISAGFVETWGRDYTPTLHHLRRAFEVTFADGGWALTGVAWHSLQMTVKLAALAAVLTATAGLLIAWLLERNRFVGQAAIELAALAAFAVPGTVLGLSYTLVFNAPPIELTGTGTIIVLCFVFRNLPVCVGMGSAALRQVDASLDEASRVLGASTAGTIRDVVVPLLRPAIASSFIYSFVRSMTTVSAVIFLVAAETELATTFIIGRVGQSEYGIAFAYSAALILLMSLAVAAIQWLVGDTRLGRAMRPTRFGGGAP